MSVFLNLWGGEGYLTSAMLLSMTSMGMFENVKNQIFYRCMDFATDSDDDKRQKDIGKSHLDYYNIIFGKNNNVISDGVTIDTIAKISDATSTLVKKFGKREHLAIGCSESDMNVDIKRGIYGKPWVGEAFYSNSNFNALYQNATGNIIIINCGGYKGGGTAATFIPLENSMQVEKAMPNVSSKRFNVIAGPSTTFCHTTHIPNYGIYSGIGLSGIDPNGNVDIFEIPEVIEGLKNVNVPDASQNIHETNINELEAEYRRIYDPKERRDYRNLNPSNYMGRFIDRIRSDETLSQVDASFINIKPNLKKVGNSFNYDITSDKFMPDNQAHKLHITNLINAVIIKELTENSANYGGHSIYTFCSPDTDKFTVETVFNPEDAKKFYRFIIFSIIITKYVYSYFSNITKPGADIMLSKWACQESHFVFFPPHNEWSFSLSTNPGAGQLNNSFANNVIYELADFAYEYIKPVLEAFMNVEMTSDDVSFFPKDNIQATNATFANGIRGIVNSIIESVSSDSDTGRKKIEAIKEPNDIKNQTEKSIAAILIGKNGHANTFDDVYKEIIGTDGAGNDFLKVYQTGFPNLARSKNKGTETWDNFNGDNGDVADFAKNYCAEIIKYTYEKVKTLI